MGLLLDSLNSIRRGNLLHGQHCQCTYVVCGLHEEENGSTPCTGRQLTYLGLTVLWQSCMCLKEVDNNWHKRMFPTYPAEEFGDTLVKWRCYEDVVVGVNERTREEKKRI
jgi:hypothetical protein